MFDDNEEYGLIDAPKHDMLILRFHGDDFEVALPYCEVANGTFAEIDTESIHIKVVKEDKIEKVAMTYKAFVEVVEKTFDIKEIVELAVQPAESYNIHKIL
jgi:hypothetical protein